jgi:hypothetical protein
VPDHPTIHWKPSRATAKLNAKPPALLMSKCARSDLFIGTVSLSRSTISRDRGRTGPNLASLGFPWVGADNIILLYRRWHYAGGRRVPYGVGWWEMLACTNMLGQSYPTISNRDTKSDTRALDKQCASGGQP